MEKKKIVERVLAFVFLIGLILLYFFEQSKHTSYKEVVSDLIGENETIEKIGVYIGSELLEQKATYIIEDQDLINRLIDVDMNMERRNGRHGKRLQNALIIKTNKDSYVVGFDMHTLTIGVREYDTGIYTC